LLEVSAPLNRLLSEITCTRLPEHVTTEIVGNANARAMTRTVAICALRLCYLKGSHTSPPFRGARLKELLIPFWFDICLRR
jgi:hypothetical protein